VECFAKTAPDMLEVSGEGRNRTYSFIIKAIRTSEEILAEFVERIADTENGLAELLITVGGEFFSDWNLKLGGQLRTELTILWRNTTRPGVLKVGTDVELFPINQNPSPSPLATISVGVDLITSGLGDEEELLPIDLLVEAAQTGEYQLNPTLCEWDWQLSIIPINQSGIDIPYFNPPTLIYWIPDTPTRNDIITLKQALVLRLEKEQLTQEKINCSLEQEKVDLKVQEIFQRLYIDNGKFVNPGSERPILIFQSVVAGSTVKEMFSLLLAESLLIRYPEHPYFGIELSEEQVDTLGKNLFARLDPYSPFTQTQAESYALPLQLVSNVNGQYEVDLPEGSLPLIASEVLKAVSELDLGASLSIRQLYARLRSEPFGLKALPQKLVLLALVSQWRIEFTSELSSDVLTAATLTTEEDLGQYTHIRIPTTISHPPKALSEWFSLLTGQEGDIDLISRSGREQIRNGLQAWQENWVNLAIADRLERLPVDGVTTRLWQMIVSCRRYFDAASSAVTSLLNEEIAVETALCQIIDSFGGKDAIYFHAVNELTILINFLEWLPFFLETKDYILSAERTSDSQIEVERS
ncbi:MAG: hypothetical protein FD167_4199, partial [bacterium]